MIRSSLIIVLGLVLTGNASFLSNSLYAQTEIRPDSKIEIFSSTDPDKKVPVVASLDIDSSGKRLAFGGDDHKVRIKNLETGKITELSYNFDWVRGLAFSPDEKYLVAVDQNGQIVLWDTGKANLGGTKLRETLQGASAVAFSPDGKKFAVCGHEKTVLLFETETKKLLRRLTAPGESNRAIVFSPNGNILAVAGRAGTARLWNVADGKHLNDYKTEGRRINALAFSPNGKRLALGGESAEISVIDIAYSTVSRLPERPGKTFSLLFCGNDRLASGESDNAIRIWDLQNRTCISNLIGHTGTIGTMVFDAKEQKLTSGSFDTTIRTWTIK